MYQPMLLYFNMLFYLLTAVATAIKLKKNMSYPHKICQHRRAHVADISPNKYQYVTLIKIRISHLYVITDRTILLIPQHLVTLKRSFTSFIMKSII
jgi:hypothetical protein